MPAFSGVVLVKKPGLSIPEGIIESALLRYPTVFGCAMPTKLGDKPIVTVKKIDLRTIGDETKQFEKINGALKTLEANKVLVFFGKYPDKFHIDDIQPFSILMNEVSGGRTTLVACLDGEFSDQLWDKKSEQFKEMDQYLLPKLLPAYEALGYDVGKLMAKVKEAPFRKELEGYFDKATLTLMGSDGTALILGKEGREGIKTDFGWMSHDLTTEVKTDAPVIIPAEVNPLDDAFGPDIPSTETKPKVPEEKSQISAKPIASTVPLTPKAAEQPPADTATEMGAPPKEWSNKAKRDWYNEFHGRIPEGYKLCPLVKINNKKTAKSLEDAAKILKNGTAVAKDTTTKHIKAEDKPQPSGTPQPDVDAKPVVIVPDAKEHAAFLDVFMKDVVVGKVDRNNDTIADPSLLPTLEQDNPTFAEYAKLPNIESSFTWKKKRIERMIKEYPGATSLYLFDLKNELCDAWRTIQRLTKQNTALKSGAEIDNDDVVGLTSQTRQPAPSARQNRPKSQNMPAIAI